jgi:hypothetical protein
VAATPLAIVGPARWFPGASTGEPRLEEEDPDGTARVVDHGLRWIEYEDGRIERATDMLPEGGTLALLRLPARLGAGFVFHTAFEGTTRLYRSLTFTGKLTPLVRLPFEVSQLVAGFDRLYAVSTRSRALIGIDVATGAVSAVDTVPNAAAYGGMAFTDGWVGAVETDVRGVLVTFDAGSVWHPVPIATTTPGVFEQGGRVVLGTARGAFALEASGELERIDAPGNDSAFRDLMRSFSVALPDSDEDGAPLDEPRSPPRLGALGARPLEAAVLRGIPDSTDTAVVISNGMLARVALGDGKLLASTRVTAEGDVCTGIRLFSGIGFVCGGRSRPTTVLAFEPPLNIERVVSFDEPRAVLASGSGALAISGGCAKTQGDEASYCVLSRSGARHEIIVRGDSGAARVVALSDGRAVVLVPPRLGAAGSLSVVQPDGKATRVALELTALPEAIQKLVVRGLWLHGFVEAPDGALSGWVAGSGPFVGVRVTLDGKVTAGLVRPNVERATLAGPFGLAADARGDVRETTDGGMHWSELPVPAAADDMGEATDRERGCSAVGCGTGSWLKVGWGGDASTNDTRTVAEPQKAKLAPTPFVTWALECAPTGESEGPEDVSRATGRRPSPLPHFEAAARARSEFSDLESSGFRTFLGAPSPERGPTDLGFDAGTEDQAVQVRAYAWGGRDAAWDRAGSWLVRAVDRFSTRKAVWSTATSRTPWQDAALAADAFGSDPSHRISSEWSAILDPVDDAGIVFIRTSTSMSLAAIEKDRAVVVAKNVDEFQLDRPAGAVKVAGKWYLGEIPGARAFQIISLDGASLSLLSNYPRYGDDSFARVVRTSRGDALGIWVAARGQQGTTGGGDTWFIHPIDLETGQAGVPYVVSHGELSHPPRACEPQDEGYVLLYEVNPSVAKIDVVDSSEHPGIGHFEAKLIAGPHGLCVESIAAQVDGDPPKTLVVRPTTTSHARRPLPLVLTDRATDRRWGLRCSQ